MAKACKICNTIKIPFVWFTQIIYQEILERPPGMAKACKSACPRTSLPVKVEN